MKEKNSKMVQNIDYLLFGSENRVTAQKNKFLRPHSSMYLHFFFLSRFRGNQTVHEGAVVEFNVFVKVGKSYCTLFIAETHGRHLRYRLCSK